MRTVRLGRTEAEVPCVSLGTWGYGGPKRVKGRPVGWSGHDPQAAAEALLVAHRHGITHWDTADAYGDGAAEKIIGGAWGRGVRRDGIFLASKVGWIPGPYGNPYDARQIRRQLERSLENLRTDHLDLYYLHHCNFGPGDRFRDEAVETLERLRDAGKIRFTGLSDWSSSKLAHNAAEVDPDVVQPYRNLRHDEW